MNSKDIYLSILEKTTFIEVVFFLNLKLYQTFQLVLLPKTFFKSELKT